MKNGVGVNRLIKEEKAIIVTSPDDIINEYSEFKNANKISFKRNESIKTEYRKIYNVLSDEPISLDEICFKTNNSIQATLNLLSLMELDDLIEEVIGCGYVKKYKE